MDKVKISKEQANLLNGMLPNTSLNWIFSVLAEWKSVQKSTSEMVNLHHWYITDPLTVSRALINGYEVEETPEDKVREYYNRLNITAQDKDGEKYAINYHRHEMQGVINTLSLLNIKIVGVNHD